MKKFFSIILSMLMACSFVLTACKNTDSTQHACESKCSVCQLCTDDDCTDSACKTKCQGHTSTPTVHSCESVCSVCGNCLDVTCQEEECEEKCEGHGQEMMTAAQFIANTSNYLSEANEGISAAAAELGGAIDLTYAEPIFPSVGFTSAETSVRSSSVRLLSANTYSVKSSIALLSDSEKTGNCAKCGEAVSAEKKYCDDCQAIINSQPTTPTKNYSRGSELEQYILFNSVARKIQLIVGATEYYTEYDFPFPNEYEQNLIGTIKFEGELTKLLKEIEDYELSAEADGFYVIETLNYVDGTFNPETGDFDKELGGQTLVGKNVRGYKLEGNTLITSTYSLSYDFTNNNEETKSEEIYVEYTMDGNNFYYEKYKIEEGKKVVIDMFDVIKEESDGSSVNDVYYLQMTLCQEEITGEPAVYFEEAMEIADQWNSYVNEKMGTGLHAELPTKVYVQGKIEKNAEQVKYNLYYFRDYDYAVGGHESSCYVYPIENWEEFYGEYYYEYTRGEAAALPESWKDGFDTSLGTNLEGMIKDWLYTKYAETLVYRSDGATLLPDENVKYYPFKLKESKATLDINDGYYINASEAENAVWSWSSSNEDVVTVDDSGYIQSGETEGEAIITVQRNNLVRYFYVIVRNRLVYEGEEEMVIRLGTSAHAVFSASNNQGEMLEFSSDDEEIVAIDETGFMTAKKEGATSVWAKTADGERTQELKVYVTPSLDMTRLVESQNTTIGASITENMHLHGLSKISITYDEVLSAGTEYIMYFDNLDVQIDESTTTALCRIFINGEVALNGSDWNFYYHEANARSFYFKEEGIYKFEFLYDWQDKTFSILEINVTVESGLSYSYDQSSNTFFVNDYQGLLAWYEAQKLDKKTNLTLESDVIMPTSETGFLFDLDGDGVNESNWGLDTKKYAGTIEGNGYCIRGLTIKTDVNDNENSWIAFIRLLDEGVIQNLNFADGYLSGYSVGGIVGRMKYSCTVLNCTNANTIVAGAEAAGIAHNTYGDGRVVACINYGTIICENGYASGIIIGYTTTVGNYISVVGCVNYGSVQGENAGGITVRGANWKLYGCSNFGTVTGGTTGKVIAKQYRGVGLYGCIYSQDEDLKLIERLSNAHNATISAVSSLEGALVELNEAIEQYNETATAKCNYRYVLNTDSATSEAEPILLQKTAEE